MPRPAEIGLVSGAAAAGLVLVRWPSSAPGSGSGGIGWDAAYAAAGATDLFANVATLGILQPGAVAQLDQLRGLATQPQNASGDTRLMVAAVAALLVGGVAYLIAREVV